MPQYLKSLKKNPVLGIGVSALNLSLWMEVLVRVEKMFSFSHIFILDTIVAVSLIVTVAGLLIRPYPLLWYKTDASKAARYALERKLAIEKFLSNLKDEYLEFKEYPGQSGENQRTYFEDPDSRDQQLIRLQEQLESTELLLADRLVDALTILIKDYQDKGGKTLDIPKVCLKYSGWLAKSFPWIAIIETHEVAIFKELLSGIVDDFIGINLSFAIPAKLTLYKGCQVGAEGVVGGYLGFLSSNTLRYHGLTCKHVTGPGCGSLVQQPCDHNDSALIKENSLCFPITGKRQALSIASPQLISQFIRDKTRMQFCYPTRRQSGYLEGWRMNYRIGDKEIRGLILGVSRFFYWQAGIKFPIFSKDFSQPGDSGSWIKSEAGNFWIGMLIGGDPAHHLSFVVPSRSLLKYYSRNLNQTITPFEIIKP